jgi:hypothetical protein
VPAQVRPEFALLRRRERQHGSVLSLEVDLQVESFGQEGLHHQPHLILSGKVIGLVGEELRARPEGIPIVERKAGRPKLVVGLDRGHFKRHLARRRLRVE